MVSFHFALYFTFTRFHRSSLPNNTSRFYLWPWCLCRTRAHDWWVLESFQKFPVRLQAAGNRLGSSPFLNYDHVHYFKLILRWSSQPRCGKIGKIGTEKGSSLYTKNGSCSGIPSSSVIHNKSQGSSAEYWKWLNSNPKPHALPSQYFLSICIEVHCIDHCISYASQSLHGPSKMPNITGRSRRQTPKNS